jgi:hypothetical protein
MQGETGAITRSFKAARVHEYRNRRTYSGFFLPGRRVGVYPDCRWQRAIAIAALAFFGFYTYRRNKGVCESGSACLLAPRACLTAVL